jgi:hypothetical protein
MVIQISSSLYVVGTDGNFDEWNNFRPEDVATISLKH